MSYQQYLYTPSNQNQPQQQQQQTRNVTYSTDNTTTTVPSPPWHHMQYRAQVPVPTLPTVPTVQHQPTLWTTQTTTPTHHHRTEATSPSTPVNPGAPAQIQSVSSPLLVKTGGTPPPAPKMEQEEMFYFSIPKGLMNRPEVRTLLGATVEDDELQTDNHTVKTEVPSSTAANDSATVEEAPTLDVQTSSMPILDPSIVPEGEGLIDG